jgi:hypothetical protein
MVRKDECTWSALKNDDERVPCYLADAVWPGASYVRESLHPASPADGHKMNPGRGSVPVVPW